MFDILLTSSFLGGIFILLLINIFVSIYKNTIGSGGIITLVLLCLFLLDKDVQSIVATIEYQSIIKFIGFYLVIGVVIGSIEWILLVNRIKDKFNDSIDKTADELSIAKQKFTFVKNNTCDIVLYICKFGHNLTGKVILDGNIDELNTEINKILPPRLKHNKLRIANAMIFWWMIVLEWVLYRFVTGFCNFFIRIVTNSFDKISKFIFGKF